MRKGEEDASQMVQMGPKRTVPNGDRGGKRDEFTK